MHSIDLKNNVTLKYRGELGMIQYQILKLISLYRYALVDRYVHMSVEVVTSITYTQQTPGKRFECTVDSET
jgi:hypothetical protein